MAQEVHGRHAKDTLRRVDLEAVVLEAGQHLAEVLHVLLGGGGGHEDVIDVDHDEVRVSHDLVHEPLEGLIS